MRQTIPNFTFLLLAIGFCTFGVISCNKDLAKQHTNLQADDREGHSATYFYNGEILLPDYAHTDTLVVTDAAFLNTKLVDNAYDVQSDGDISDLLGAATVSLDGKVLDLPEEYILNNKKDDLTVQAIGDTVYIGFKLNN